MQLAIRGSRVSLAPSILSAAMPPNLASGNNDGNQWSRPSTSGSCSQWQRLSLSGWRMSTCGSGVAALRHNSPSPSLQPRSRQQCKPIASAHVLPDSNILAAVKIPLGRDMAAMLFSLVGAVIWVKLFDFLARHEVFDRKLSRKLVHITAGPLFVLTWPFFSWEYQARFYAAVIPVLQAVRLLLIGFGVLQSPNTIQAVSREGNRQELLRGPLYYVLILGAVTAGCWRGSASGLLVIALMCGGDGLADIIGRRFGSVKLPYNRNKSWAGSMAMLLGSLVMASALVILFARLGFLTVDISKTLPAMAAIAVAATVVESLPINHLVDDNLSVPAIAAILGYLVL